MELKVVRLILSLVFLAIAGCTAVGGNQPIYTTNAPPATPAVKIADVTCTRHEQVGCLEMQVLNLQYNARNPVMQELLQDQRLPIAERTERMKTRAPQLFKAYQRGEVAAAAPNRYLLLFWDVNKSVPMSAMNSWKLNGMTVNAGRVEDVTESFASLKFGPFIGTKKPDRIYRVTADGMNPAGVSFQAPFSFFGPNSTMAIYPERPTVYPGPQNALWVTKEQFGQMHARNWTWAMYPVLNQR